VHSEIRELVPKWGGLVSVLLHCVSREDGSYINLPYDGGAMRQPSRTMQALDVLQEILVKRIRDEYKRK